MFLAKCACLHFCGTPLAPPEPQNVLLVQADEGLLFQNILFLFLKKMGTTLEPLLLPPHKPRFTSWILFCLYVHAHKGTCILFQYMHQPVIVIVIVIQNVVDIGKVPIQVTC